MLGVGVAIVVLLCVVGVAEVEANAGVSISVDSANSRRIPDTLFGIFFEEINHAGAGGLWAELVSNRGFEAGSIDPWGVIGGKSSIKVTTDLTSCFEQNKVAIRMDVLSHLPDGVGVGVGVGIYNPGYWGMNIVEGETYKITLYSRSSDAMNLTVSFTSADGSRVLASNILAVPNYEWMKAEIVLKATASDPKSRLQLTTTAKGLIWFDQVSAMPTDAYKGHGFRKDLMQLLLNLKPRFLRFPGGCFVEGVVLKNAFRWKQTVGPWEDRPGHLNDAWGYWTDDGLGYLEFLQLAEDLAATPVWVVNAGIAHHEQVNTSLVGAFVQDMLDSLEFARGDINSFWGSLRAKYGHPKPFDIKYVAIGNEDCWPRYSMYRGNYLKFYYALKAIYPDINVINNCDPTYQKLDVPAEMVEYHTYDTHPHIFSKARLFDGLPRLGPKVFVSEYAVYDKLYPNGNLIASIAEAGFLIGLELNSDVISMASYAPLLVNRNDQRWRPDAIHFDTWQAFGTPSYWMQTFFIESSGSTLLNVNQSMDDYCISSAVRYMNSQDGLEYVKVKVVNFQENHINVTVTFKGISIDPSNSLKGSKETILTSKNPYHENSFENPIKVIPRSRPLKVNKNELSVILHPYSLTSFDLRLV